MPLCDPVIIMGMHKSGTTLLAEMVHKGGIPMFSGDVDPSYDAGIKYERQLCQELNAQMLGFKKRPKTFERIWRAPLQPAPPDTLRRLEEEVGNQPWGFKDPRTIFTYDSWLKLFPRGPRLYAFRGHDEVLHRFCSGKKHFLKNARRAIQTWLRYNEKMLENMELDEKANRPLVLVRYEELMASPDLPQRAEKILGIKMADARNPQLHRNKVERDAQNFLVRLFTMDSSFRVARVYKKLDARRLAP
jgi:hypothetical protein